MHKNVKCEDMKAGDDSEISVGLNNLEFAVDSLAKEVDFFVSRLAPVMFPALAEPNVLLSLKDLPAPSRSPIGARIAEISNVVRDTLNRIEIARSNLAI